jgi:hypothetical protein
MKVIEFINEYNPDVWEKKNAKFIIRHGNYDLGAYYIDYANPNDRANNYNFKI